MRILTRVLLAVVIFLVFLAVVGLFLPRNVHVERSTVIGAPSSTVYALVSRFKSFNKWSPWYEKDPAAKYTFEGPESGAGARMTWAGDPKTVGSGSQEIIESRPYEFVKNTIDFGAQGKATSTFALSKEAAGTKITWGIDSDFGANPFMRYMAFFFDGMIGPDYERGLAKLKKLAEGMPKADFSDLNVERIDAAPVTIAYVSASTGKDPAAVSAAMMTAYGQLDAFMKAKGLTSSGPPLSISTRWDDTGYGFDAGFPLAEAPQGELPPDSPVKIKKTYQGSALKAVHKGPYTAMEATYDKLFAYAAAYLYEENGPPWEVYVNDSRAVPEADVVTEIYLPVK